jgi:hypothetical protein
VGRVQCLVGPRPNHSIHATGLGKQSDYTALLARSSGCLADARFHLDRDMHYYPFGEELPDLKLLLNHITECLSGTSGVRQLAPTALLHCSTTHARSLVAGLFLCPDWNWDMMAAPPHGATNCDPTCARVPPLPGAFHFFVVAV